jgi:hypothetical protein
MIEPLSRRRVAGTWAALLAATLMLVAAPARAEVQCRTDDDCLSGGVCTDHQCVYRQRPEPETTSGADKQCGADRRCRIRRLARKNRARRRIRALQEELRVQVLIEQRRQRKIESINRRADPWTVDFHGLVERGPGMQVGYSITPQVKFDVSMHTFARYVASPKTDLEGSQDFWIFSAGAAYYFFEYFITPYARAAFAYRTGTLDSFYQGGWSSYDPETGEWVHRGVATNEWNALETEGHNLVLGAGVDLQLGFGFHMRLGLNYYYSLFNEVRMGPGEYHEDARAAVASSTEPLDFAFAFGWAF